MKIVNGVLITFWNFKKTTMKVFVLLFFIAAANAKLLIEKWEMQVDSTYSDVKYSVKDQTYMTIDAHTLKAADDVVIEAAVYSKVDGVFNPFVKPEPIHVCKIHEHEDPLIKFIHDEIIKFGNITKACPVHANHYYYLHDFRVLEQDFPMPLPAGEFRVDVNASYIEGGNMRHVASSETYFKIVP
ncbi:hypothetical protein ACKWTF_016754 [Chironomus riparius]